MLPRQLSATRAYHNGDAKPARLGDHIATRDAVRRVGGPPVRWEDLSQTFASLAPRFAESRTTRSRARSRRQCSDEPVRVLEMRITVRKRGRGSSDGSRGLVESGGCRFGPGKYSPCQPPLTRPHPLADPSLDASSRRVGVRGQSRAPEDRGLVEVRWCRMGGQHFAD